MRWNDQQLEAIASPRDHLVVVASAGAGKTEVIVQRYLRYVKESGFSPEEILAVTYTHRAAAAMKHRIVKELRDAELYDAAQLAETGPIQTIHSFYERLLRENSVWAGLNPDFEILADYESNRLWDLSLRQALTTEQANQDEIKQYRQATAGKRKWGSYLELDSLLREQVIGKIIEPARNIGMTWQYLRDNFNNPKTIQKNWEQYLGEKSWPNDADLSFGMKVKLFGKSEKRHTTGVVFDQEVNLLIGLCQLASITWELYEREMVRTDCYDFTLLESKAIELLTEYPSLAERIRSQYRAILLDESQDANPNQFGFLTALNLNNSLTVGDGQQSIYRFRGSVKEIFETMAQDSPIQLALNYRSHPGIINFVNHLYEKAWEGHYSAMAPGAHQPTEPMNFEGVEILESHPDHPAATTANFVKNMIDLGEQPGDIVVLVRNSGSATTIQGALDSLGIPNQASGTSESLFTRMEARDMANLLTACVHPENDFVLACLLHSPYVGVTLDTIVQLGQQSDIFNHLETFEPIVTEDKEKLDSFLSWFVELKAFCDRYSAYEIINRALTNSPYLANLGRKINGERNIANTRKLLTIATTHPDLTPLQLADRFRHLQVLSHREPTAPLHDPDDPVVRIMTIHKSKGLEFKNVIVYGHDLTPRKATANTARIVTDFRNGMAFTCLKGPNLVWQKVADRNSEKDLDEEFRLLYVALTRAQNRLVVGVRPPSAKGNKIPLTETLLRPLSRADYPKFKIKHHPAANR